MIIITDITRTPVVMFCGDNIEETVYEIVYLSVAYTLYTPPPCPDLSSCT
jgi:hypothetical protein